jgi:esterase/lipase superfamily enzyme
MQKQAWTWTSPRLPQPAHLVRWGHFGTPVLIFPTAGGDREEIERFHLIDALGELIERGRMKAYSIEGLWVRAELCGAESLPYESFVYEEVLPRIREDCQDPRIEPILAGASRGAAVAVGTLCRHPDSFRCAIGISGVYPLAGVGAATRCSSPAPLTCLAQLEGATLEQLRRRTVVLGCGAGDYENPEDSRRLSATLAGKGVACRLSLWGPEQDHTWSTWREQLPRLLAEQL